MLDAITAVLQDVMVELIVWAILCCVAGTDRR